MSKYQTPCRYDFVGSFLRPEEVKKANADYQEGKISEAEKNQIIVFCNLRISLLV